MSLSSITIARLFQDGVTYVKRQDGSESLNLYCHVVEGAWCYFVQQEKIDQFDGSYDPEIENKAHQLDSGFAKQITRELGVEYIAQSRNNGVKVRCTRPDIARMPIKCEVDRGGGWEVLSMLN